MARDYPRERPWAKHYQHAWQEHAADRDLPLWFRVTALAYAHHEANGHANFKRGALMKLLGTPPIGDEPFKAVPPSSLQYALKFAIGHGFLDAESCTECLVVPGHAVVKALGDRDKPCPVHVRKRLKKQRPRLKVVDE